MSPQLRLPGVDPSHQIQPSARRRTPTFWVRRLCVLRELKPGAELIVREVTLRRGLNIVWAPAYSPVGDNTLFQNGVAGHTAGKTTFCRLLRHILGEPVFATEATRRRLRIAFPTGWVVAEVVVGDELWTVARPFSVGAHPFCVRGGTVEDATDGTSRQQYQLFLEALGDAAVSDLSAGRFPANDAPVRWDHVLPWLSRDQECRYSDFLEWRHSSSQSEAPALNVDERQFVVRAVLGLISDEERAEQQTNARLVATKKEAALLAPLLSHQAEVDHRRVVMALGVDLAPVSTPLFGSEARAEIDRRTEILDSSERQYALRDQRADLRNALEQAVSLEANAKRDLDDVDAALAFERETLKQLAGAGQAELLVNLPPPREYCGVRMSVARENECPLAGSRPIAVSERRSDRSAADEVEDLRVRVQRLEAALTVQRDAMERAGTATRLARRDFMAAATAFEEERGRIVSERAQVTHIERLIRHAEEGQASANEQTEVLASMDSEIDDCYRRQEQLRLQGRAMIDRLSATFDYVVRAILGDDVTGRVDTTGRSIALVVEEHGERESAAIETVKLLAFDLAAMVTSAEGRGSFPRFLIHDGPREADMASDIYDRLFLFVREFEKCFDAEPSFQYIVTTTTAPPSECAMEPTLRLTLAGVPAMDRFLRCDL